MGRGLSQRRRLKNFNSARQAKSRTIPLPPPPEEVERKRKKQRTNGGASYKGPASFRKMMQLKEAVEKKQLSSHRSLQENLTAKQRKNKFLRTGRDEAEDAKPDSQEAAREEGLRKKKERASEPSSQEASLMAALYPKKPLKPRKKEFLKMKKLKKKGKAKAAAAAQKADEDTVEDDSDPEELVDTNTPAFGEQAMQPLKVNLKRKHWAKLTAGGGRNHLVEVFERQMQDAEAKQ